MAEKLRKEKTGTIRPLLQQEIKYFEFARRHYQDLATIREGTHKFNDPPPSWKMCYSGCPNLSYREVIDTLSHFVLNCKECSKSERDNWSDVLSPLSIGSLDRVLWSIAFLKSTNGVADKVSCGHFRHLIKDNNTLSIRSHEDLYKVASILRQTSKWVKNTFVVTNIFRYIEQEWNGVPSQDFSKWLDFYEIGPKTGSLIFYAAFGKMMTLPVDSHV